eukprot:CAMPEP_0168622222 /NCGR_PEP_ID=MMETSP0449_2-20121227/8145_1 /TAXON_ID=1082188 /ORGANISM="Strombidium rassoulzadegani, Strain ras09" /LENGTH=73 /DNA_ID=CAMNT_0008663459 /DNA_START=141 /DNA_END=362 /DNA_ORIENTATION=+
MVCSFVPYLTKVAALTSLNEHFQLFYGQSAMMGCLNGVLICALTLSYKHPYILGGAGVIGSGYGLAYAGLLRY